MELRDFAQTVLFATDMETKLSRPNSLTDDQPGAPLVSLPALPGRPAALRFLDAGESRPAAAKFPSASLLKNDRERGRVMHFFANHELLALELMALMLLRYPDAPASFRLCLAGTMLDEQKHLGLYMERMSALSVEIGDLPCGRFFWDSLRAARSPRDFLAGMSLTFEQANLDFSLYYLKLMEEHDDLESREVLLRVHDDEVRHVRRGLDLFRAGLSDAALFDDYRSCLDFPLGAHHGKGRPFSRESRQAAGLPEPFIDEMEALAGSRGRPPRILLFNPAVESELRLQPSTKIVRQVESDLGVLPALQASADEIILVHKIPSLSLRLSLVRAGFNPVEWHVLANAARSLEGRPLSALQAFGPSPRSTALAQDFGIPEVGCLSPEPFSKSFDHELRQELRAVLEGELFADQIAMPRSEVCRDLDQALIALRRGPSLVKANFSSAGRGSFRWHGGELSEQQRGRLCGMIAESGAVVVEELLARELDMSLHFDIDKSGSVRCRGLLRFYTDRQGQFLAAETAAAVTTMDSSQQRFMAGEGSRRAWFNQLQVLLADLIARRMAEMGAVGPVGLDMMLHRDPAGELKLHPLVEFNPRLTMGRITWAAGRRIKRGCQGLFAVAAKRGGQDETAAAIELASRWPLSCDPHSGLMDGGILLLGDLEPTPQFLPLLAIGDARSAVMKVLRIEELSAPGRRRPD